MGGTQPAVHVGKMDTLGELCWDSVNWPSKLHPSSCKLPIYIMSQSSHVHVYYYDT